MDPTDAVRTRLTHSMEVSSVARGLARAIARDELLATHMDAEQAAAMEAVVATVALLHDIGNPPFGHAGEGAIRDWFARHDEVLTGLENAQKADFKLFEGNAQTLRLVSRLQLLVHDQGLNLTCATMSALQKYVCASSDVQPSVHAKSKPGFFQSEAELVAQIREETGVPVGGRNPMTLVMEAADDICFAVVDIEDGVKKHVTDWGAIREALKVDPVGFRLGAKAERYVGDNLDKRDPRAKDEAIVQMFRVNFIEACVRAASAAFAKHRADVFSGSFADELLGSSDCAGLIDTCKRFARQSVYPNTQTLKLELLGRRVISDLLSFFWDGAQLSDGTVPDREQRHGIAGRVYKLSSENYRRVFERNWKKGLPDQYLRLQLATDQVCGMTDGFACRLHEEIAGG